MTFFGFFFKQKLLVGWLVGWLVGETSTDPGEGCRPESLALLHAGVDVAGTGGATGPWFFTVAAIYLAFHLIYHLFWLSF